MFPDARPEIKVPADTCGVLARGVLIRHFAGFVFVAPIFAFLLANFGPNLKRKQFTEIDDEG